MPAVLPICLSPYLAAAVSDCEGKRVWTFFGVFDELKEEKICS